MKLIYFLLMMPCPDAWEDRDIDCDEETKEEYREEPEDIEVAKPISKREKVTAYLHTLSSKEILIIQKEVSGDKLTGIDQLIWIKSLSQKQVETIYKTIEGQ